MYQAYQQKIFNTEFAGRPLSVEIGKYAEQSNGACMVRYGETVLLCTATMSQKPRDGIDYFPLSVDFEERLYSVGKIPGSFLKREGRPSEKAVLTSRVIDRPIRPLFPKDMRNDVAVVATVMSVDPDNTPEVAAMVGISTAIAISDIPWDGPVGSVQVGLVDGKPVLNPTESERAASALQMTVSGSVEKVCMIEAGASEVPDDKVYEAIMFGFEEIKKVVSFINGIVAEVGKPKLSYTSNDPEPEMLKAVMAYASEGMKHALNTDDKNERDARMSPLYDDVQAHFADIYPESAAKIEECLYYLQKYTVRRWILDEGRRVDGRGLNDIRSLSAEVGLLPRAHGSGLFKRGQTQVMTVATLGPVSEQQMLDGIDKEEFKRYMHHYNMPGYSTGEAKPSRSPGRREIGHGALAERALEPVIPSEADFPYAIRLVSEVLSSNGSTSQGAICGSTLALMDAGVPIKAPVAGISCGLVTEGDRWITMLDIQGVEDFFGDMDFKVAGTKAGITAIQMDIKINGLTPEIIKAALDQTREARYKILDEVMLKAIPEPRAELSKYAPKMLTVTIDPEKIREVIGPGGKIIQKIIADTGTKIDVEDDGRIFIASIDIEAGRRALEIIKAIVLVPEVGSIYKATVTRLMTFGAFAEFAPGKEGLIHISKLADYRVNKVEDVVNVGDEVMVKIVEIDDKGRINLSRKDAMKELADKQ